MAWCDCGDLGCWLRSIVLVGVGDVCWVAYVGLSGLLIVLFYFYMICTFYLVGGLVLIFGLILLCGLCLQWYCAAGTWLLLGVLMVLGLFAVLVFGSGFDA